MAIWRPTRPSRANTRKRCPFHHRGLECKSRKSRDTWTNRQVCLKVQNEGGQMLTDFCQENTVVIANTLFQQHETWLYTAENGEALCSKNKTWSWLGSDHQLLIAKFRLKMKKVGKTAGSFKYDLNHMMILWLCIGADK